MHKSTMDTFVLNELMGGWLNPGLEIVNAGTSVCPIVLPLERAKRGCWNTNRYNCSNSNGPPGDAAVKCYYYLFSLIGLWMDRFIGAAQLRQPGNTDTDMD